MIRFAPIAAAALLLCSAAQADSDIKVPPFSSIAASAGADVKLSYGPVQRVTLIKGDLKRGRIEVRDGHTLTITGCEGICIGNHALKVEVVAPRIESVVAHSGADIEARGNFPKVPMLYVKANSGGDADAEAIPADSVDAEANSGGAVKVKALNSLKARASSGGDVTYTGHPPHIDADTHSGGDISGK